MPIPTPSPTTLPLPGEFDEIIDVRSPSEFLDDHLPEAINLPVLDDLQRQQVGTEHAHDGSFQARRSGATLITANISEHLKTHFLHLPKTYRPLIYCWRGGLRSQSLATILSAIGWRTSYLQGGYKSYRRHVIDSLETLPHTFRWTAINGLTGTGKTRLLHHLAQHGHQTLDLEGLANHKGSLLGADPSSPQPTQKHFENRIHQAIAHLSPDRPVFVEAESKKIGNLHCPEPLWAALTTSTVIHLDLPLEKRIDLLLEDYHHYLQDPALLQGRTDLLRDRYGHGQVDAWHTLIQAGDWRGFVASILQEHYDTSYRRSTRYPAPTQTITLPDLTPTSLDTAAQQLLEFTNSPTPHHP